MSCAFIGDSIALGLSLISPSCHHSVHIGASSFYVSQHVNTNVADVAIISAGSNDPNSKYLIKNLYLIRNQLNSRVVVWVLPNNKTARNKVLNVATYYSDQTVKFRAGKDHVHPKSYQQLLRSIKIIVDLT